MSQDISPTEKQQFWLEHVQACSISGKSMRAYAQANCLSVSAFYSWKKTLRGKGLAGELQPESPSLFRKAVVSDRRSGHCCVRLPSGLILEFDADIDPHRVAALVRALP
jgi:transposase